MLNPLDQFMIIVSKLSFLKGMLVLLFVVFFYLPHTKTIRSETPISQENGVWDSTWTMSRQKILHTIGLKHLHDILKFLSIKILIILHWLSWGGVSLCIESVQVKSYSALTLLTGMKYMSTEAFWNFKNYIAELKNKIEITQKPCPKHAKN